MDTVSLLDAHRGWGLGVGGWGHQGHFGIRISRVPILGYFTRWEPKPDTRCGENSRLPELHTALALSPPTRLQGAKEAREHRSVTTPMTSSPQLPRPFLKPGRHSPPRADVRDPELQLGRGTGPPLEGPLLRPGAHKG